MSAVPSLTPNEDAVRAALAASAAEDAPLRALPGTEGTFARLNLAMREARAIAVAREIDRGIDPATIVDAFSMSTALEIVTIADFAALPARAPLAKAVLASVGERVGTALAAIERGALVSAGIRVTPVDRANPQ